VFTDLTVPAVNAVYKLGERSMTEATRRDRGREDTDREIRGRARALLVKDGHQAVTLRAIARDLGITAPALYRYYSSREDLMQHLRQDICADAAAELRVGIDRVPDGDPIGQLLAACRGFRRWALAHPQEFTLVFASLMDTPGMSKLDWLDEDLGADPFGRIFLVVAGRLLAAQELTVPADDDVPPELRGDLDGFRQLLMGIMAADGIVVDAGRFTLGVSYAMLQVWVRLYGQVTLEVFGRFPLAVSDPAVLFDRMLADLVADLGLSR
jgi:AcrR family transcriptional regulator